MSPGSANCASGTLDGDPTRPAKLRLAKQLDVGCALVTRAGNVYLGVCIDTGWLGTQGVSGPNIIRECGKLVRHTHIKDSKPEGSGIRYVLPATGTVPLREIVAVLARGGYTGYYCFEWEKAWHPDIEEPEVAFPRYAGVMRTLLADSGVKAS